MSVTFRKEQVTRQCGHPSGEEASMKNRETCRRNMLAAVSAAWLATGLIGHPPGAALADPPGYVFTRLATVPGPGPGTQLFDLDFEPHSINAAGNVAFAADLKSKSADGTETGIGEGVFASRSGQLLQIIGPDKGPPGGGADGGGTFISMPRAGVFGFTPLNNAGGGAFVYFLEPFDLPNHPKAGLYRFSLMTPQPSAVVVPGVTPAPTGGVFASAFQGTSLNDRGDIVFPAIAPGLQLCEGPVCGPGFEGFGLGLFKADAANRITAVVIPGDPAPGPGGKVFDDVWQAWVNNRGTIGFEAHVQGEECVDLGTPFVCGSSLYKRSAKGEIESIAHQGDPAPCRGTTYRLAFGAVVNEPDELVFVGDLTPSPKPGDPQILGVFVNSQGKTTAVACPDDPMPGGGRFATTSGGPYGARLNNRGDIAFVAQLDTRTNGAGVDDTGLYVLSRGQLRLVARTDTFIPGVGTIAQIIFSDPAINDRGQILFQATLKNETAVLAVLLVASPNGARLASLATPAPRNAP
jgi:hypothetical protein